MERILLEAEAEENAIPEGNLVNWVSYSAIVFTIGLFSSGILTCRKIHNSKSVGVVPYLPFVAASTNCSLWLLYGTMKPDFTITLVNTVGLTLQLLYIFIYHTYVENKFYIRRDFVIALSIIVSVSGYFMLLASDHTSSLNHLGVICNFFTICFFASPLSTMAEVIKSKSTDTMSFPLSVMSFLTTLSWTLYGFLIKDTYVTFPNTIGLLLSIVQLSLFLLYPDKSSKRTVSLESPA